MDINATLDDNYLSEFNLSAEIKAYLQETAKWARFIAIVGFVFVGLMVLMALGMGAIMGSFSSELGSVMPFSPALFSAVYLVMAAIMAVPLLYLYKFANNMLLALRESNEVALTDAFRNLKSHYKFYGIFMAIILGFYALMFLIGIISSAIAFS